MRVILFANNWVGWQVARWLGAQPDEIVGLVIHSAEKQRFADEIVAATRLPAERILDASRLKTPDGLAWLRDQRADIGVSLLFDEIFSPDMLRIFPRGVINLHPALLPHNRGQYPNIWSIVDGTPSGVSLHYVDAGIDTGDLIAQRAVPVELIDTGETLYRKLERACVDLFTEAWPAVSTGTAPRTPQQGAGSSHRRRDVDRIDEIDLARSYPARELINVIRARTFPPHAGAFVRADGEKIGFRLQLTREPAAPEADASSRAHGSLASTAPIMSAPSRWISINGRRIGPGEPAYVIAEMSANHRQDFDEAVRILRAAKAAGADAIKLQTYTPDTMTIASDAPPFRITGTLWHGRTLHELYGQAATPWEWQPKLQAIAAELGIDFFSTAFDATAVDFLEGLHVPAHKIASFEMMDLPLVRRAAATGKPLIISTGMAGSLDAIRETVDAARAAGAREIALLKCTSAYPAPADEVHLRTIPHLADTFQVPVGLSDHTEGIAVAIAAVALGACLIEKHLTLSRSTPSPDAAFSLEPEEFAQMVRSIRQIERARGSVHYGLGAEQGKSRVFCRSLFVVEDVKAGELLSQRNVRSIRPGDGLHPRHYDEVLGRRAVRDIARGTPLSWDLIDVEQRAAVNA